MPVLLFCQCGSDRVDVTQWNASRARLRCFTCEREAWLDGFTISDFDPGKLLGMALVDQARKHRKRSPRRWMRSDEPEPPETGRPAIRASSPGQSPT